VQISNFKGGPIFGGLTGVTSNSVRPPDIVFSLKEDLEPKKFKKLMVKFLRLVEIPY